MNSRENKPGFYVNFKRWVFIVQGNSNRILTLNFTNFLSKEIKYVLKESI